MSDILESKSISCVRATPGLKGVDLLAVRVYAVSQLRDWRQSTFRGAQGYKFRALIGDHTHIIDVVVWDEKKLASFLSALHEGTIVALRNVCSSEKNPKYEKSYFSSIPCLINVNHETEVTKHADQTVGKTIPVADMIAAKEFKDASQHPVGQLRFKPFYDLDIVEHPSQQQGSGHLLMPSHDDVMALSLHNLKPQVSDFDDSFPWVDSDQHDAEDAVKNNLPFLGINGTQTDKIDKERLSPGTAFELIFPDAGILLGRGVVVSHRGELKFFIMQGRQTVAVGTNSIFRDPSGIIMEDEQKSRLSIRRVPHDDFIKWRRGLDPSVYRLLNAEKPVVDRDRSNKASRSQSQPNFKCLRCEAVFGRMDNFTRHLRSNPACLASNPGHVTEFKCKWCDEKAYKEEVWFNKHVSSKHPGLTPHDCLVYDGSVTIPGQTEVISLPARPALTGEAVPVYTAAELKDAVDTWPEGQPFSIRFIEKESVRREVYTSEGYFMGLKDGKHYARYIPTKEPWLEYIDCTETCEVQSLVPIPCLNTRALPAKRSADVPANVISIPVDAWYHLGDLIKNVKAAVDNGLGAQSMQCADTLLQYYEQL